MSIDELQKQVTEFRDARDWKQFHMPKDLAAAIAIESSELQELFLWKNARVIPKGLSDELADIAIYLLSLCDVTGIDLSAAVQEKIRKNEVRYPVEISRGSSAKSCEN